MNIEEKLEELQKDIAYMRVDVLAIREYVVEISKELQKMQQPKVCKWVKQQDRLGFDQYCDCAGTANRRKPNYCPECGGKIEIDKETK